MTSQPSKPVFYAAIAVAVLAFPISWLALTWGKGGTPAVDAAVDRQPMERVTSPNKVAIVEAARETEPPKQVAAVVPDVVAPVEKVKKPVEQPAKKEPEPEPVELRRLGESFEFGDVSIHLHAVVVEKPFFPRAPKSASALVDKPRLVITLGIFNNSETKRFKYRTWSRGYLGELGDKKDATLVDNFGNDYAGEEFETIVKPFEFLDEVATVNPGGNLNDALYFEPPIKNATTLTLTLDGAHTGLKGKVAFEIPVDKIKVEE